MAAANENTKTCAACGADDGRDVWYGAMAPGAEELDVSLLEVPLCDACMREADRTRQDLQDRHRELVAAQVHERFIDKIMLDYSNRLLAERPAFAAFVAALR